MKLEDQVANLELSMKLKKLGVPQKSIFYYMNHATNPSWKNCVRYPDGSDPRYWDFENKLSAFTVAELGEMLPNPLELGDYKHFFISQKVGAYWEVGSEKLNFSFEDKKEANARAKMLIHLIEQKVIDHEAP